MGGASPSTLLLLFARGDGGSASGVGRDFGGGMAAESLVSRLEDPVESPFRDEFVVDGEGVSEPPLCLVRFDRVVTSSSLSPDDGLLRRAMEGSGMGCPRAKSNSTASLIYDEISLALCPSVHVTLHV